MIAIGKGHIQPMVISDLFGKHFVDPGKETADTVHPPGGRHRLEASASVTNTIENVTPAKVNLSNSRLITVNDKSRKLS